AGARAIRGRLRGRLRARARGPDRGGEARSRGVGHRHRRHRRDPGGPPAVSAAGRARAIVDLGAVERNCALLAGALGGGARLCAVVKANGYGHGAVECARAALAGGASALAVATAAEAVELRAALPEAAILVMGALTPDELEAALGARAEIAAWRPGGPRRSACGRGSTSSTTPGWGGSASATQAPCSACSTKWRARSASSWPRSGPTSRPPTSSTRRSSASS